tara:strand:- start:111 stop:794 length:684 start_codon:yes stop_codon:yes gene_type:complete
MSVYVTFFKAHGVFEGSFNHLVSWWTGGEFCHSEIVFELTPGHFMKLIKHIYTDQSESDQKRLMAAVEQNIYENKEFRNMVQNESTLLVSFSLLWGDQLRLRFLKDKENIDPWCQLKNENIECIPYNANEFDTMCIFALQNLGKPYDTSSALTSWMPTFGIHDTQHRNAYFCSEFVADVLKKDTELPCTSFRTTPNHLYDVLNNQLEKDREDKRRADEALETLNERK